MIFTQQFVTDMCESIGVMKLTEKQKDFVRAAMRAAIEYANAKNHMHASPEAKAAARRSPEPSSQHHHTGE